MTLRMFQSLKRRWSAIGIFWCSGAPCMNRTSRNVRSRPTELDSVLARQRQLKSTQLRVIINQTSCTNANRQTIFETFPQAPKLCCMGFRSEEHTSELQS